MQICINIEVGYNENGHGSSDDKLHILLKRDAYGRKERNVLFNNALNTFYLWLYGKGSF